MNAEPRGAADFDDGDAQLHERLARRFDAQLARAERDYSNLNLGVGRATDGRSTADGIVAERAVAERTAGGRRQRAGITTGWPRLASTVVAVGVLAVVGLIGVGLASQPDVVHGGPSQNAESPSAEPLQTIPAEIDGQKVYTVAQQDVWQNLDGSFLLRAYVIAVPVPCPSSAASTAAEFDLVPACGDVILAPYPWNAASVGGLQGKTFGLLAPKTLDLLTPWLNGPEIVIRVHSHDSEAAQCGAEFLSQCENALVVEGVVWASAVPTTPPVPSPTAASSNSIPAEIDGQKVYSMAERDVWNNLDGSFLLRAYALSMAGMSCPRAVPALSTTAETDLVPKCGTMGLAAANAQDMQSSGSYSAWIGLAPKTMDLLTPWLDGPEIVIRGHTHDPEAAQCGADSLSDCESALVIEAVVWPEIPTEIDGQKVYSVSDQAEWENLTGSFYLGAYVQFSAPSCPPPQPGESQPPAEQELVGYCSFVGLLPSPIATWEGVDLSRTVRAAASSYGLLAPFFGGSEIVMRVHTHDPQAAECSAAQRDLCDAAVVVEAVVWPASSRTSTPTQSPSPPTPSPTDTSTGVEPSETPAMSGGPTSVPTSGATSGIGSNIPASINGETVYRAANMPPNSTLSFLLGGVLESVNPCAPDVLCPIPATLTVDGLTVENQAETLPSLIGTNVVVRVERSKTVGTCTGDQYPLTEELVVTQLLCSGPAVVGSTDASASSAPPVVALPSPTSHEP